MDNDKPGAERPRRRRRQWADIYEVTEESGPEGKLLYTTERWEYHDAKAKQAQWPTKRDVLNVLIGAAAALVLEYLRSSPT